MKGNDMAVKKGKREVRCARDEGLCKKLSCRDICREYNDGKNKKTRVYRDKDNMKNK